MYEVPGSSHPNRNLPSPNEQRQKPYTLTGSLFPFSTDETVPAFSVGEVNPVEKAFTVQFLRVPYYNSTLIIKAAILHSESKLCGNHSRTL